MAALNSSPSGFSYAQAARGQASTTASQTPSSKVTSGTATPATGGFSDLGPSSNWADDVEATVGEKPSDSRKATQEQSKPTQAKDSAVERAKSESRPQNGSSGVSSPDLTAASSTTTNTDDSSSAPSGTSSSDTTWDTKSQSSEPAWIAERKERQSNPSTEEGRGKRGKKESSESKESKESKEPRESKDSKDSDGPALPQPPQKPVVLQEAPPPAFNIWAKRLEDSKCKPASTSPQQVPKPSATASTSVSPNENQRPRADSRRKANSVTSVSREPEPRNTVGGERKKSNGSQGKRTKTTNASFEDSSPATEDSTSATSNKALPREHQSLPNLAAAPPSVKDEISWPTPESAQEKERKETSAEKESKDAEENGDAESASGAKPHQKTKWKPIPVTPTIVWQTEEMNRPPRQAGDRGGRGGNSSRGRGGFRGGQNGSKGGDRSGRNNGSQSEGENGTPTGQRGRSATVDRENMPPPAKPFRQSSASEAREARGPREQGSIERPGKDVKNGAMTRDDSSAGAGAAGARRTKSPVKMESSLSDDRQDLKISEPTARQASSTSQTDEAHEGGEVSKENLSAKRGPSDGKKGYDGFNGKEWNGSSRGAKRGGRGRGGSREYSNAHQASQPFPNGHSDFSGYGGFSQSPSAYSTPRGFNFSQQGRGGWRGNPRSQSIPIDNAFGGRAAPFWPQQLAPVAPYYPGMVEYNGMPISGMPYPPMGDHQLLVDAVSAQLEYYFSLDNLLKDLFLRKNMDSQGFVFLDVIANFNRIKQLTVDKDLLRSVCLKSENIEIRVGEDGKERLRPLTGWEQFLLPLEQREPTAQNAGPKELRQPEQPHVQFFHPSPSMRGLPSAGPSGSQRRSYDSGYHMNGAMPSFAPFSPLPEAAYGESSNGEEVRGRATKSPFRDNSVPPGHQSLAEVADETDLEPDVFPDEHASSLTVVVKPQPQRPAHHHVASRTFSNGSIDTRSIFSEIEKSTDAIPQPSLNGDTVANGEGGSPILSRHASSSLPRSPEKGLQGSNLTLLWVKDKEMPQEKPPQDATLESYVSLRNKALSQRHEAATGTCPYDLDVLYQFWSHFLIRNFNRKMYREFKGYAHSDGQDRHTVVGLQNLVQFYAKALESGNPIRDQVVKDYVSLVNAEPPSLQGLAFKQLRQAWRNGALNLKNRKKLADIVDEKLKARLES
ncbi:Hypothetical predicted protein [Lecanosticta acicola]|uniref:HTH La-type RNA-binding domain-containing protein n=1 Tax=Lecanosticta acicola TaxID=111012 RepID=A0AAI8Z4E1_9PEZI|nr:Hypothetical predicted protein [Lecanosticta acicola]